MCQPITGEIGAWERKPCIEAADGEQARLAKDSKRDSRDSTWGKKGKHDIRAVGSVFWPTIVKLGFKEHYTKAVGVALIGQQHAIVV
jgi:hypothetical protein